MLVTILSTFQALTHLVPLTALWDRNGYGPHSENKGAGNRERVRNMPKIIQLMDG